ncbi:MAG: kynureninase [Bacteroidota bacterium]
MIYENTLEFAQQLDARDPLKGFRNRFHMPKLNGKDAIYFCGNSLGLQPKTAAQAIQAEMLPWQDLAVEGHFKGENPWLSYHKQFKEPVARLIGALPHEVVVMNNLTVNLHLMLVSFYQPNKKRFKILMEAGAFPSDQYAVESQVKLHQLHPDEAIVELKPRKGEFILRTEDIIRTIIENRDSLALVLLGGVNYYTGQVFDMAAITEAAHLAGAKVGYDLAHAAGNVLLRLHDWQVDFAVWCTYKYLNSSPGGVAGAFVHEQHANNIDLPRLAGWWGHDEKTRFQMKKGFIPMPGADGWQLSNSPILLMAVHKASLDIFDEAGMANLRKKSVELTKYLAYVIEQYNQASAYNHIHMITPRSAHERGCQLSLLVEKGGRQLFEALMENGVIGDWREPNVIRLAPTPLYNTFEEVYQVGQILAKTIKAEESI